MSESNGVMDFGDLTLAEVPVRIQGEKYTLREAVGDVAVRYRNRVMQCTRFNAEGRPSGVSGMADVEPFLVSLCLFKEDGGAVSEKQIRSWPNRVQKALFDKAKEISELGEDESLESLMRERKELDEKIAKLQRDKEFLKNELEPMMDGSS